MKQFIQLFIAATIVVFASCGGSESKTENSEKELTETEKLAEANKGLNDKVFKITTAGAEILNEEGKIADMFKQPPFRLKMKSKKVMQEGEEVSVRSTKIFKNDTEIAIKYEGEIDLLTNDFQTEKGIGVGSTIEEFVAAYPDYKIWYTYVSNKYVIETPGLPEVEFILDPLSFIGDENVLNESDMVTLTMGQMNVKAKITTIKVFEIIGC